MKYLINESQVEILNKLLTNFINSQTYEGVCYINVDYDDQMNKFVINIFFDRNFFINKPGGPPAGGMTTLIIRNVVNDVGIKFQNFTGKTPLMYQHFDNC
jgi:hypothetical protein